MTKPSEVSGQICPGSCCMLQTMMKSGTASRHTLFSCETWLCKLQTHLLATPCIPLNFCICLCSRMSVALSFLIVILYFPSACWESSVCVTFIHCSHSGAGWRCQASVHDLHRSGASQDLRQAGNFGRFSGCWNIWDTNACVADEPGDAGILFSSLEKSSIILIINYFWCILMYFYFFFSRQVTCTDSQVTARCSTVNRRVGNQVVHTTIYMIFFFFFYSCHFVLDWVQF